MAFCAPGTAPTSPPDRQAQRLTPGRGCAVPEKQGRASTTPQRYQQRPMGSVEHPGPCCRNTPPAAVAGPGWVRLNKLLDVIKSNERLYLIQGLPLLFQSMSKPETSATGTAKKKLLVGR